MSKIIHQHLATNCQTRNAAEHDARGAALRASATHELEIIRRKARYGHKDYLFWIDASGALKFGLYCKANIKAAILDVGAKGRFHWYDSTGCMHVARSWRFMVHLWKCAY